MTFAVSVGALVAAGALVAPTTASSAPTVQPRAAVDGVWTQVGAGFTTGSDDTLSQVFQLISRDQFPDLRSTPGPLYAAGSFIKSGSTTINRVARLVDGAWTTLPGDDTGIDPGVPQSVRNSLPVPGVYGLVLGGDDSLYAGGVFSYSDDSINNVAKWNGNDWVAMGFGLKSGAGAGDTVQDVVMGNDFIGGDDTNYADDTVYALGAFEGTCQTLACTGVGAVAQGIAEYSQATNQWRPMGDGTMAGSAFAGAYIDDTLYIGGNFTSVSGRSAQSIAQWGNADDTWIALGGGMSNGSRVYAMAVHPVTRDLYIGGYALQPHGYSNSFSPGIVKWDYSDDTWAAVGTGFVDPNIDDIAFSADGTTMWVGMDPAAGQVPAGYVAQMTSQDLINDGATTITGTWGAITSQGVSGVAGPASLSVNQQSVRAVYGVGNDSAIFGGNFHTAGPITAGRVARFSPPTPIPPRPPRPPSYPPDAPTGVTAVGGVGTVTVSWAAPSSTGSFPITNYRVTATPGGATCEVNALTCTFTTLSVGTSYTFQAQAFNAEGWGALSAPSNVATPLDPPPPPPPASITIDSSQRVTSGRGTEVAVTASSMSIAAGTAVVPWTRIGRGEWTPSPRPTVVADDGSIAWKRKFGANRNRNVVAVKFVVGEVESAAAILRPVH